MPPVFQETQITYPYISIKAINRYVNKWGLGQLPIASPTGFAGLPVAIVQLVSAHGGRIFTWAVSRQGKHPQMPDSRTGDTNEELVYEEASLENANVMASADVAIWSASGVFVYVFKKPVALSTNPGKMWFAGVPYYPAGSEHIVDPGNDVHQKMWQQQ